MQNIAHRPSAIVERLMPFAAGIGLCVDIITAPLVSLVATPVFAVMTLVKFQQHKKLNLLVAANDATVYGRINGQDYRTWNGRTLPPAPFEEAVAWTNSHERKGFHLHGQEVQPTYVPEDCPFQTEADLNWLVLAWRARDKMREFNQCVENVHYYAKRLIPLLGYIWSIPESDDEGPACPCTAAENPERHWTWNDALNFHCDHLANKLAVKELALAQSDSKVANRFVTENLPADQLRRIREAQRKFTEMENRLLDQRILAQQPKLSAVQRFEKAKQLRKLASETLQKLATREAIQAAAAEEIVEARRDFLAAMQLDGQRANLQTDFNKKMREFEAAQEALRLPNQAPQALSPAQLFEMAQQLRKLASKTLQEVQAI